MLSTTHFILSSAHVASELGYDLGYMLVLACLTMSIHGRTTVVAPYIAYTTRSPVCPSQCVCSPPMDSANCSAKHLSYPPIMLQDTQLARQIHSLDLSVNALRRVKAEYLAGYVYLQLLYLQFNNISRIDSISFEHNAHLEELHLEYNSLTSVEPHTFQTLVRLKRLYLHHNHLTVIYDGTFDHLDKLEILDFTDNQLSYLSDGLFLNNAKLQLLSMAANPLSRIHDKALDGLPALRILNLTDTRLRVFPANALKVLESLDILDVSYNDIQTLNNASVQILARLQVQTLNLTCNPVICDCQLTALTRWIQSHNNANMEVTCASPNHLSHVPLKTVPLVDLVCVPGISNLSKYDPRENDSKVLYNIEIVVNTPVTVNLKFNQKFPDRHGTEIATSTPSIPEELRYNPMLGWYTAGFLLSMLLLFMLGLLGDKLKRRYHQHLRRKLYDIEKAEQLAIINASIGDTIDPSMIDFFYDPDRRVRSHAYSIRRHSSINYKTRRSYSMFAPSDIPSYRITSNDSNGNWMNPKNSTSLSDNLHNIDESQASSQDAFSDEVASSAGTMDTSCRVKLARHNAEINKLVGRPDAIYRTFQKQPERVHNERVPLEGPMASGKGLELVPGVKIVEIHPQCPLHGRNLTVSNATGDTAVALTTSL